MAADRACGQEMIKKRLMHLAPDRRTLLRVAMAYSRSIRLITHEEA
jgi:hypothetical protein